MLSRISQRTEISSVVNSAVENLQDLGRRFKTNHYGNEPTDTACIEGIVEALKELDAERIRLHELLETETIKASVLRYKLQYFPGDIYSEIQAAVISARQSNEAEIKRLKDQLNAIHKNINELEKRHHDLQTENSKLEPDRNDMQTGHDEIIALLNQKMADKASKQITLNETRDKLRETYKRIIDLEESIVQLKEDLVHEREEARLEKEKLRQSVEDTKKKVEEQRKLNVLKRREIDKLQEELVDSESMLDSKRKTIRKYETSRARLEAQEVQLNRQLQKEIRDNAALTQEGMKTVKEHNEISETLGSKKKQLEEQLDQYKKSVTAAERENAELTKEKEALTKELDAAEEDGNIDAELVRDAERKLARAKEQLSQQNQECGRLQGENLEMEQDIADLKYSHQATVDVLNKQIDESKASLVVERKDRQLLQNNRDNVTKETNEFKSDYGKYMATMSKSVVEGKAEHSRLTEYGTQLQKDLKKDEEEIINKQKQLKKFKHDYTSLQKHLKIERKNLQESISKLGKEQQNKTHIIEDKTPIFKNLELQFKKKTEEFEAMKKGIVDMKNKKATLETTVQRAEKDVEKMAGPQMRFREKLKHKRAETLNQLKRQAEEIQCVEKEIFTTGQKLGAILKENHTFKQAIKILEIEIESLQKLLKGNTMTRESLAEELLAYRDTLREGWKEDFLLDKVYAERDVKVLANIDQLQQDTYDREKRIDDIHDQLEEQLRVLSHFIDGVANLRPKGTASSQKKTREETEKKTTFATGQQSPPLTRRSTSR